MGVTIKGNIITFVKKYVSNIENFACVLNYKKVFKKVLLKMACLIQECAVYLSHCRTANLKS